MSKCPHKPDTWTIFASCYQRVVIYVFFAPDALPAIRADLHIVGYHSTLTRTRNAGSFSLLTTGVGGCGVDLAVHPDHGDCSAADLTVINVNFTDGGGSDTDEGGAIHNRGTLDVEGGTFSGNKTGEYGGAIYNDGHMTVTNATFTGNLAPYGGGTYTEDEAPPRGPHFPRN